jgi:hypothetical protein
VRAIKRPLTAVDFPPTTADAAQSWPSTDALPQVGHTAWERRWAAAPRLGELRRIDVERERHSLENVVVDH